MARTARKLSHTGIYHVMLRGINKQQIFFDEEDHLIFLHELNKFREVCHYEVYAYCLMRNHIHLLLKVGDVPLGEIFKRIGVSFVLWYNTKYQRVGHLFQDRFKSEAVEDDRYFMTVLRYILNNPVKAKICSAAEDYRFSSAAEYVRQAKGITDTGFALRMTSREQFIRFLHEKNDDQCMEDEQTAPNKVTDREAARLIMAEFGTMQPDPGKKATRVPFANSVNKLRQQGVSVRQFCRLTGLSKNIVERC